MINGGGKYWPEAGSGAAKATSASAAARRTTLAFTDAFLLCDLRAARRDLSTRQPAEEIPSGAAHPIRLFASPVAHLSAAWQLRPQLDDFCASP
jgi:hypothetical protein